MARILKICTIVFGAIAVALVIPCHFVESIALNSVAITAFVTEYHFLMRLIVGAVVPKINAHSRSEYKSKWFAEKRFERKLYEILKVKKWKKFLPTYDPDAFDIRKNSLEQIYANSCNAEAVHEVIIVLSFLPILLYIPFGVLPVFVATSLVAAMIDSIFVIMQRFNRPRLLRLISKQNALKASKTEQ